LELADEKTRLSQSFSGHLPGAPCGID
jgi:hypothetical protein